MLDFRGEKTPDIGDKLIPPLRNLILIIIALLCLENGSAE